MVKSGNRPLSNQLTIALYLSPSPNSASHVDQRIDAFLESFYHDKLCNLTEEDFQGQVEALVNLKLCADVHLGEEVDRNWWEVLHHTYVFDRLIREVSENSK